MYFYGAKADTMPAYNKGVYQDAKKHYTAVVVFDHPLDVEETTRYNLEFITSI